VPYAIEKTNECKILVDARAFNTLHFVWVLQHVYQPFGGLITSVPSADKRVGAPNEVKRVKGTRIDQDLYTRLSSQLHTALVKPLKIHPL